MDELAGHHFSRIKELFMTKIKQSFRLPLELSARLREYAEHRRTTQTVVVEAAISSFLSSDSPERMERAFVRRLDRMTRQLERLERDIGITNEAIALFVQHWLITTPRLSNSAMKAARASGRER